MQHGLRAYAGPGHWNDPDMLQVGNLPSVSEDRAHFTMWAMLAAPLIAGNDLREMSAGTLDVLTNRDVIEVNQDPLGIPGFRHSAHDGVEVWFRPLANEDWAMVALNRTNDTRVVSLEWADITLNDRLSSRSVNFSERVFSLRDLWEKTDLGTTGEPLDAAIPGRDVIAVRLSPRQRPGTNG